MKRLRERSEGKPIVMQAQTIMLKTRRKTKGVANKAVEHKEKKNASVSQDELSTPIPAVHQHTNHFTAFVLLVFQLEDRSNLRPQSQIPAKRLHTGRDCFFGPGEAELQLSASLEAS